MIIVMEMSTDRDITTTQLSTKWGGIGGRYPWSMIANGSNLNIAGGTTVIVIAHGNNNEIGNANAGTIDINAAVFLALIQSNMSSGAPASIYISTCGQGIARFAAAVRIAAKQNNIWNATRIFGHSNAVDGSVPPPNDMSWFEILKSRDDAPPRPSDSGNKNKKMTSKSASHHYHYSDPASSSLIKDAHSYFDSLGLAESDELDPNIQDSDGLVSYIVASSNPPPKEISDLYEQVAPVMEGLTNVVTAAVIKQAGTNDQKKHDPGVWKAPMNAMCKAFCAGFSEETKHYDKTVKGIEVATSFLNILIEAAVSQGAALASFVKFLESQGETMRAQASNEGANYLYASVSIIHEIYQATDGRWIYVPKFKSYFTTFTRETFKVTTSCGSYDSYRFKFDLEVMTGAFMVESWKNYPSFRKNVKEFIVKFQKTNIADSENYFDQVFQSSQD